MALQSQKSPILIAFERIGQHLHNMAIRLLGDEDDANDALQDAFVKLWVRRTNIQTPDEAAALMTTTVHNLSIDRLRERKKRPHVSENEYLHEIADDATTLDEEADERYSQIRRIIAQKLTPLQQQIIDLRDYNNRSYDEIAQMLHMQPTAVRMQLSRARKTIRELYRELLSKQ